MKPVLSLLGRYALTLCFGTVAALVALQVWNRHEQTPWTRDARVSAEVVQIAPEVSGTVGSVSVADNQYVHRGDILYVIDRERFLLAVASAQAERRRSQLREAVSQEDLQQTAGAAARSCQAQPRTGDDPGAHRRVCHQSAAAPRRLCHGRRDEDRLPRCHQLSDHQLFRGNESGLPAQLADRNLTAERYPLRREGKVRVSPETGRQAAGPWAKAGSPAVGILPAAYAPADPFRRAERRQRWGGWRRRGVPRPSR